MLCSRLCLETRLPNVAFYSPPSLSSLPRNLLAADADGSVSIYDADPFVLLKSVKIHKKSINSMSVHPSGKIALTAGHDQCMALVNSMVVDEKVSIHEAEDAKLIVELDKTKKVLCVASGAGQLTDALGKRVFKHRRVRETRLSLVRKFFFRVQMADSGSIMVVSWNLASFN